jgi:WD40 repeat protein
LNINHAWISADRIAVATEDSKVFIYESAELKQELGANLPTEVHLRPHHITCCKASQSGFITGTNNGFVQLWEKTDDANLYKVAKEIKIENSIIRGITISSNDDTAICALDNNQLVGLQSLQSEDVKIEKLSQAHHNVVNGLDVCFRKPLVVTCGSDQSVRIWNYVENTMEMVKFFKTEPVTIAFHPSGLFLLVGFTEGIKLLKILLDDIKTYWEYSLRGCREVCCSS